MGLPKSFYVQDANKNIIPLSVIMFMICLITGALLSSQKLLWTDELHTQINTVDHFNYSGILTGQFPEGNLCPLFYIIQETVSKIFHYHFSLPWKGENSIYDLPSQLLLRIPSNICVSIAVTLLFWFFARFYSLPAGWLALTTTLSCAMVWSYWVEARPYSLWFLLSTIQSLLLLHVIRYPQKNQNAWLWMGAVHILLSTCVIFSAPQILVVSCLFWIANEKKWFKYLWITALPATLCYFYYLMSKRIYGWLPANAGENILSLFSVKNLAMEEFIKKWDMFISINVPFLWLLFFLVCACFLLINRLKKTQPASQTSIKKETKAFLALTFLLLASAFVILKILDLWKSASVGNYSISERYFIFLVPTGVITFILSSLYLLEVYQNDRWMRWNIKAGIAGMLLWTGLQTYFYIISLGLY